MNDQAMQLRHGIWQVFEAFLFNGWTVVVVALLLLAAMLKLTGILPSKR